MYQFDDFKELLGEDFLEKINDLGRSEEFTFWPKIEE